MWTKTLIIRSLNRKSKLTKHLNTKYSDSGYTVTVEPLHGYTDFDIHRGSTVTV